MIYTELHPQWLWLEHFFLHIYDSIKYGFIGFQMLYNYCSVSILLVLFFTYDFEMYLCQKASSFFQLLYDT